MCVTKVVDAAIENGVYVEAEPLLEAYWWWLETLDPAPGSKLADAVTYAKNQKKFLNAFWCRQDLDPLTKAKNC